MDNKARTTIVAKICAALAIVTLVTGPVWTEQVKLDVAIGTPVMLADQKQTVYLRVAMTGFEIDDFADNTLAIRSVPVTAGELDVEKFLETFAGELKENRAAGGDKYHAAAASVACHGAWRAGDRVPEADLAVIMERVAAGEHELRCPHGRPYVYRLTKNEIERMFKRS